MKLTRWMTLSALLAVIIGGALFPVGAQDDDLDTLRIAFIGRETGAGGELDRQLFQAAVTAAEQINAGEDDDEAGLQTANGESFELEVIYYPADTADDALDAFSDVIADDVVAVLGPHERDLAEAIQDAGTQGLAVLLGASDSPDSDSIFRVTASLTDRAQAAADFLINERHFSRVGVFASNTNEALAGIDAFRSAAGDDVIVVDITREADDNDLLADARALRDADAEALFVWALDSQTATLLRALRDSGWDGEIVYTGLDADFVAGAGMELTEGLYGVVNWTSAAYDSVSQAFVTDYRTQWGITPPDAAASYYDAVYLLGAAAAEVGVEPGSIRAELASQSGVTGAQGGYDSAGTDALRIIQARSDGSFIEVVRYADAQCQTCPDTWWADNSGDSTTTATFRIGLIAALDGAAQAAGDQVEQAARLAVREINEAGGVVGSGGVRYTLDLVIYSAETGEAAGAAFQQAVTDGAQVIIGPDFNAQALPNLFRAESEQIVQLVSATSDQVATNGGSYVYQLRAVDSVLASTAARYLLDVRELTRFATVAARTDYGLDSAATFADTVSASDDGEVLLELEHDVDEADFSRLAEQIVSADVQAAAVWSTQPALSALAAELQARGWDGVLTYGYLTPDLAASISGSSVEIVAPVNWWATAGDWVSQDFAARYSERYGDMPIPQAASYYDAIYLVAAQLNGSSADGLQTNLDGLENFVGVQGSYRPERYDSGELTREVIIVSLKQGAVTEAARYDDGICLVGCG